MTEQTEAVEARQRPPRRRHRGTVYLVAIILVLVAIAVVGDRLAAKFATEQLRTRLVAAVDSHGVGYDTIDVTIGGFPFLTQVAKGKYDAITIDMTGVRLAADGRTATLPTLHAVASGVNAKTSDVVRGDANVVADQVTGTAVVSYATLQSAVDYSKYNLTKVTFAPQGGALKATAMLTVPTIAGITIAPIPLSATANITVASGHLQVELSDLSAAGADAVPAARNLLANLATTQISALLPQLPFGLKLQQVQVQPQGLAVSAKGLNVALTA